ncbi:MAG: DnaJ domain-containing protein [SAR324 cluster bacterium]|nr:DnaJ domain-containing protein [SAR324 cluster bacterium]
MNKTDYRGTITAYPLTWPAGWYRTPLRNIQHSRYHDRSIASARDAVTEEVRLLGGNELIISSNLELRQDGLPRSRQRQPEDKGVAIYFHYRGKPMSFACDQWNSVEDNLWAINLTIEAIRMIERAGASDMMERAFRGFEALPAPPGSNWWEILGVAQSCTLEEVQSSYRSLVRKHHPDMGGSIEFFHKIQEAYKSAQSSLSQ